MRFTQILEKSYMANLAVCFNQEIAKKNEVKTYILAATAARKNEAKTRGPT
jgi:hypothetical protein